MRSSNKKLVGSPLEQRKHTGIGCVCGRRCALQWRRPAGVDDAWAQLSVPVQQPALARGPAPVHLFPSNACCIVVALCRYQALDSDHAPARLPDLLTLLCQERIMISVVAGIQQKDAVMLRGAWALRINARSSCLRLGFGNRNPAHKDHPWPAFKQAASSPPDVEG